jgi:hypothetical protein
MTDTIILHVVLNGVDVTDHIDLNETEISITSALNQELDTLSLTLKNGDVLDIKDWQEIKVLDDTAAIFGGYVITHDGVVDTDKTKNAYETGASDYAAYLKKAQPIQHEFLNKTDKEIIEWVFANSSDLSEFDGSTFVTAIQTIPRVVFNREYPWDILDWLAEQSGGYWYVDYDKKVHYFGAIEFRAPFGVTNNPLDIANVLAENVTNNSDGSGVVNAVQVIGGNSLVDHSPYSFTRVGNSTEVYLNKRLKPQSGASKIVVRRNDGGATTNLLVNPSFEVNITDGWTQSQVGSGAAWAQDATKYNQGSKSLKITAGTGVAKVYSASITLAPGEALSVQAMSFVATLAMASIAIYDATNLVDLVETVSRKTSSWERLTATYINESSASLSVRVELRNKATDSSTVVNFDAAQAEKLSWPSAYCDGSLGTGYAWTGTANNSTSTRVNMPVWRTLTVKTGNSDELSSRDEVLYFESDAKLVQETYWPTLSDAIEVDGQEEIPVRATVRNYASHAYFGKWFWLIINESSIVDVEVARMRAATELAKNAYSAQVCAFDVRKPGLRSGQTIRVYLPQRNLDGDYLIQSVQTTISVGGHIVSKVSIGAADPGLVLMLLKLKKASKIVDLDSDELIDQVLDFSDDLTISDEQVVITHSQGPYLYDVAKWDYAKYGSE